MNILVDFITAKYRHGSGEYHRRVVQTLLQYIVDNNLDVNLYAFYDSLSGIAYDDFRQEQLTKYYNIQFLDIQKQSIEAYVQQYEIDRFFVACAQRLGEIPGFDDVTCPIVCVTHDLAFEDMYYSRMHDYLLLSEPVERVGIRATRYWRVRESFVQFLRELKYWMTRLPLYLIEQNLTIMRKVVKTLQSNPQSVNVVVSNYTKASMMYNFDISEDKIKVCYSPERIEIMPSPVCNLKLKRIISEGKKFYLLMSADRPHKNAKKVVAAFRKYVLLHPDMYLVSIAYGSSTCSNHIDLEFLSDSDLNHALRECYALIYPSFFEGFGYPPLEAMKYGKPVLSTNVTSLPEVLGDAAIYFSPLYETAIFEAMLKLTDCNYPDYQEKSNARYKYMREKQEQDLQKLISIILKEG